MSTQRAWTGKVFIATSLDGLISRADGDISWLTDPPDADHVPGEPGSSPPPGYDEFIAGVDHLVMGRGTYEKVLTFGFWPYGKLAVLVLSTTLPSGGADGNVTVLSSLDEVTRTLAANGASGVYVDGGQVIQTFLAHDLIDELTISTAPVLIGGGLPLFGTLDRDIRLTHEGTSTSDSGMTSSRYSVIR